MAYPCVLHGPEGEQLNTYTTQRWPLGTLLMQQDGRKYRFCSAGDTTLARGDVQQSAANLTNHIGLTAAAMPLGTRSPTQLLGNTAAVVNEYAGGFLQITVTPDGGSIYGIGQHDAVAGSATLTANLSQGYKINTAWTTSTRTNFVHNPFRAIIQVPVTTITQMICGVACSNITNAQFGWVQTAGPAAVFTSGVVVLGNPAGYIQVAGALGLPAAFATDYIGAHVMLVGGDTAWSLMKLYLDA